jgi:hypothetical protein
LSVAGGVGLKGVAAATPSFAFVGFGFFAKLLLTAEFFGKGFSRDRPITAFLSLSHKPSHIASHGYDLRGALNHAAFWRCF